MSLPATLSSCTLIWSYLLAFWVYQVWSLCQSRKGIMSGPPDTSLSCYSCVYRVCGRGSCWRNCCQSLGRIFDSSASLLSARNSWTSWETSSLPWPSPASWGAGPHSCSWHVPGLAPTCQGGSGERTWRKCILCCTSTSPVPGWTYSMSQVWDDPQRGQLVPPIQAQPWTWGWYWGSALLPGVSGNLLSLCPARPQGRRWLLTRQICAASALTQPFVRAEPGCVRAMQSADGPEACVKAKLFWHMNYFYTRIC